MELFHIVARTYRRDILLSSHPLAPKVWSALGRAFPNALAAVVMPDHVHVIAVLPDASAAMLRTGAALSAIRRTSSGDGLRWEPLEPPRTIPDTRHLQRQIRYVSLNPCRSGLAADPLEWIWSTHRDVAGAVIDPWVSSRRLGNVLGEAHPGFAARWHKYVSGDPSVHVSGTRFPSPAAPSEIAKQPLGRIIAAAAAAHRAAPERLLRRGAARATFLALAYASGWHHLAALGRTVDASRRTALRRGRLGVASPAAWLCLGDPRLTKQHELEIAADAIAPAPFDGPHRLRMTTNRPFAALEDRFLDG